MMLLGRRSGFDVERAPLGELGDHLALWAGRLAAGTCWFLTALAAFDRRGGWKRTGASCCSEWLAVRCGTARRTAVEQLRVARVLETLPVVRAAFAAGRLSYSKVRALTRVATPDDEPVWAERARRMSAGELEQAVTAHRRLRDDPEADHATRRCVVHWDDKGRLRVTASLSPDRGAVFVAALDAARASLEPDEHGPAGSEQARTASRAADADALAALADAFLAGGAPAFAARHAVTVLVDADLLADRGENTARPDDPCCEVGPGHGVHPATAQRLACDSVVTALLVGANGDPLAVGRTRRTPPRRMRTALLARDRHCTYPGCTRTRWLHAHHCVHWAHDGPTQLENLTFGLRHHRSGPGLVGRFRAPPNSDQAVRGWYLPRWYDTRIGRPQRG